MGLLCSVVCVILRLAVLIQYRSVTDRQTHTHRHTTTVYTALSIVSRGKNSFRTEFENFRWVRQVIGRRPGERRPARCWDDMWKWSSTRLSWCVVSWRLSTASTRHWTLFGCRGRDECYRVQNLTFGMAAVTLVDRITISYVIWLFWHLLLFPVFYTKYVTNYFFTFSFVLHSSHTGCRVTDYHHISVGDSYYNVILASLWHHYVRQQFCAAGRHMQLGLQCSHLQLQNDATTDSPLSVPKITTLMYFSVTGPRPRLTQ